jgi:hypothetical protein
MERHEYNVVSSEDTSWVVHGASNRIVAEFKTSGDGVSLSVAKMRAEKLADMLNAGELMEAPDRYYVPDGDTMVVDRKSHTGDWPVYVYENVNGGVGPFPATKVAKRICAMLNEMDRNGELD